MYTHVLSKSDWGKNSVSSLFNPSTIEAKLQGYCVDTFFFFFSINVVVGFEG